MRSVRCDVCGTKALMAASTCPKCGHGFEVRDGFGEMLPLAHCPTCDSYYPQHLGSCRWCGTKPERAPIGPYMWKGLGIATFIALAIGAWLARDTGPSAKKPVARTFVADTLPTNQPPAESYGRKVVAHIDSAPTPASDAVADSARQTVALAPPESLASAPTGVVAEPVVMQSAGAVAADSSAPPVDSPRSDAPPAERDEPPPVHRPEPARVANRPARPPARPPARTLAKAPARVAPAPKATIKSKSSSRWVVSVARNWAVVRSDPTRQSRILAAIGPNTRVQLGETRGAWRRIRTKGLAGWVEHRTLGARPLSSPRKTGRLAARLAARDAIPVAASHGT